MTTIDMISLETVTGGTQKEIAHYVTKATTGLAEGAMAKVNLYRGGKAILTAVNDFTIKAGQEFELVKGALGKHAK